MEGKMRDGDVFVKKADDSHDKAYVDEAPRSLGRSFGLMFAGMVETGMSRDEALEVVKNYSWALASKPTEQADEE